MAAATATTFLSRQGYSILKSAHSEDALATVKKELTVSPFVMEGFAKDPVIFKLYQESANKLYVPKYYGLSKFGAPHVNRMPEGDAMAANISFTGSLRPEQAAPVKAFMDACADPLKMGGILNLTCASGKTVMAIYLMCRLGKRALVIVHKDFLLNQWKERIEQFAPAVRVGMLKAKIIDVADKDIVLASLQSLSMKDYDPTILEGFGTVVVDECHHTSAEVFSQALKKVTFRYALGLSATIQRKDGLTKVFKWYLGDVVYSNCKQSKRDVVEARCFRYYDPHPSYGRELVMMRDKLNTAKMINNICDFEPRNRRAVDIILEVLAKEPERKVLVLSDRKSQLATLSTLLRERRQDDPVTIGFYLGGMKTEELKASEVCQVLLGTFQMVSEGFDVKALDTLMLASPKSDVVQSVGRILRETPELRKHVPLILDIVDDFSLFQRQGAKRLKYYKSCKYDITGDYAEDKEAARAPEAVVAALKKQGPCFVKLE